MIIFGRSAVPRHISVIANEVGSKARSTNAYLQRMENLYSAGRLNQSDLLQAYSGAFLAFHSYTELALERVFFGVLMGRLASSDRSVRALVRIDSEVVARRVVFNTRSYADWIPYSRWTVPRAEAFLSRGKPFTNIAKADCRQLDNMAILRNALAHQSSHAIKQFTRTFTVAKPLPPSQLRPSGYLRGSHAAGQTRANYLLAEAVRILRLLCQ